MGRGRGHGVGEKGGVSSLMVCEGVGWVSGCKGEGREGDVYS